MEFVARKRQMHDCQMSLTLILCIVYSKLAISWREFYRMETIDWSVVLPAGFALVILVGGLWMLFSGMLSAKD